MVDELEQEEEEEPSSGFIIILMNITATVRVPTLGRARAMAGEGGIRGPSSSLEYGKYFQ